MLLVALLYRSVDFLVLFDGGCTIRPREEVHVEYTKIESTIFFARR